MKQRLRDILLHNNEYIQYIGILDNEGVESVGVSIQGLKDNIKEKTYHNVFKTMRNNFNKTCAGMYV